MEEQKKKVGLYVLSTCPTLVIEEVITQLDEEAIKNALGIK